MISTITLNPSIDKTIYIAKLAPNDTNRVTKVETDAGGKGLNCSRMLKQLGVQTKAITFLGGKTGDFVRAVLDKEEIVYEYIATDKPTRSCIDIQETNGVPPTCFNERGGPVEHSELVALLEMAKNIARESSYMVLGGSVPVGINQDVYNVLIQIATAGGAKAVLDADGEALVEGLKAKPFMIKPNLDEAERLVGKQLDSKADVARAALQLGEQGIELVIISLGKQGAVAAHQGKIYDVVPPEVKVLSTIGSGDSMIAGVLCGLEQGMDIQAALCLGAAAGAATAMSSGCEIGTRKATDELISQVKISKLEPTT